MHKGLKSFAQNSLIQKSLTLASSQSLSWVIISFGVLVRLVQYLSNRSLWNDEAALALNIVNKSYLELFKPLDYEQGAPIGFLVVEKLAVQLFGNNEYSLRLFPLLSGIVSLLLFYELAKRCISREAIPIALTLFVGLDYLLYYSSEAKQYSTDVAIALLSCLLVMQVNRQKLGVIQILTYSLVGAIAVWFSHPAIFVLAGVGTSYCVAEVIGWKAKNSFDSCLVDEPVNRENLGNLSGRIDNPQVQRNIKTFVIYATWILSFLALYFLSLKNLSNSQYLLDSWRAKAAFPTSLFDINWAYEKFIKMFTNPLGFPKWLVSVALVAFITGCITIWLKNRKILLILTSPFWMTLLAGYLQKYPFRTRLVLFLAPFILLIISAGTDYLIKKKTRFKFLSIAGYIILGLLLFSPITNATYRLINPYVKDEIKPVLSYVKHHRQPEDIVYIYQRTEYQFRYYAEKLGYRPSDYIMGIDDLDLEDGKGMSAQEWERYKADFDQLRGNKRVWIILSHITHVPHEETMVLSYLNSLGKPIDVVSQPGSFAYLYDLS